MIRAEVTEKILTAKRLKQLNIPRTRSQHGLTDPLRLIHFKRHNLKPERAVVSGYSLFKVSTGDAHMIDVARLLHNVTRKRVAPRDDETGE